MPGDLYETVELEGYRWEKLETNENLTDTCLKKLLGFKGCQTFHYDMAIENEAVITKHGSTEGKNEKSLTQPLKKAVAKVRGPYRSCSPEQIQKLLVLVIE